MGIQRFDMFKTNVKWLYKKEQFGSYLGAKISLVTFILLSLVFYPSISSFLSFNNFKIDISQIYQTPERLTYWENDKFTMAVQLQNYNGTKRAFDVYFTKNEVLLDDHGNTIANITERYMGIPCNTSDWQKFGQKVYNSFKFYMAMNGTLVCNPPQFNMSMYGRYSTNSSMLVITIERCNDSDCLTDQQIQDQSVASVLPNIFYPQTTFQYNNPQPISLFLQQDVFCFIRLSGSRPVQLGYQVMIEDVLINDSDVDVWPTSIPFFHKNNTLRGFQIDRIDYTNQFLNNQTLVHWRLRKSSKTLYVTRTIDKIDDVFSYIGGVLGFVLLFGEVVRNYNQKLLMLRLGSNVSFSSMGKQMPIQQKFTFYKYIKFMITSTLWGSTVKNKQLAQMGYTQKVCFVIDYIQKMVSIDLLLERIRKCQILLQAISGQSSFKVLNYCMQEPAQQLLKEEAYGQVEQSIGIMEEYKIKLPRELLKDVRATVIHKLGERFKHRVDFGDHFKLAEQDPKYLGSLFQLLG